MKIKEIIQLNNEIKNILNDNKAIEIKSVNLKEKTSIADFMIVASGTSSRHIQALSEILLNELKKKGIEDCRLEGRDSKEWKLIDAKDIIIHIFHPEKRKFYNLEKMWSELIPKERLTI
jgi:ribosome-associated protein